MGTTMIMGLYDNGETGGTTISGYGVQTASLSANDNKRLTISTNGGSFAGENGVWIQADNNITLNPIDGKAYVRIGSGSSYLIGTAGGNLSSLNLKENLKKFEEEDYNDAIELLKDMDLYSYDYKYNVNDFSNNYGFIIDYLKANDKSNKFFNFEKYKAVIKDNKALDEQLANEEPDNKNIIEYERYNQETLTKYILTICKAQQQEIEELKERITKLESESDK
jgi:hypothetical protein